jgi:hypothetical protein
LAGRSEISDYFGAKPQPGSLNVVLEWPILFRPERAAVRFDGDNRLAWPAILERRPCLVHRWQDCPLHIAEIISPYRFQIQKNACVVAAFDVADTAPVPWPQLVGWAVLWLGRRERAYTDDKYADLAAKVSGRCPALFRQQHIETS